MRSPKILRSIAAAALFCAMLGCSGDQLGPRAALEEEKPAEEALPPLPPYPSPENLARVETGALGSFEYFVDTASLQVIGKGEYRYTLVARSAGATNVTYEALRCLSRERRLYATGRPDGTWVAAKKSEWTVYSRTQFSQIPVVLAEDYLCPNRLPVVTAREAVQALRYGRHPGTR
jgi:hypothetical protein